MVKLDVKNILVDSFKFPIESFGPLLQRCGIAFLLYLLFSKGSAYLELEVAKAAVLKTERLIESDLLLNVVRVFLFLLTLLLKASIFVGAIQVALGQTDGRYRLVIGGREIMLFLLLFLCLFCDRLLSQLGMMLLWALTELHRAGSIGVVQYILVISYFLAWIAFLYAIARLVPIWRFAALENRILIKDSWRATRGVVMPIVLIGMFYFCVVFLEALPRTLFRYFQTMDIVNNMMGPDDLAPSPEEFVQQVEGRMWWWTLIYLPVNNFMMFVGFAILAKMGAALSQIQEKEAAVEQLA